MQASVLMKKSFLFGNIVWDKGHYVIKSFAALIPHGNVGVNFGAFPKETRSSACERMVMEFQGGKMAWKWKRALMVRGKNYDEKIIILTRPDEFRDNSSNS